MKDRAKDEGPWPLKTKPPAIDTEAWQKVTAEIDAIETWAIDELDYIPDAAPGESDYSARAIGVRFLFCVIGEANSATSKLRVVMELRNDATKSTEEESDEPETVSDDPRG